MSAVELTQRRGAAAGAAAAASKDESAPLLAPAGAAAARHPGGASRRHREVVQFLKSVWHHNDVPMTEQQAPNPSARSLAQTREEARHWHDRLGHAPRLHSRRFFLVEYGVELLEETLREKQLHVQIVMYTIFVLIFINYINATLPVRHTFAIRSAIHDAVVDRPWTADGTREVGAVTTTLRGAREPDDVWEWFLYGLAKEETNFGPFSPERNVADWNLALGAVRVRQVRLLESNCELGDAVKDLPVFDGVVCHGVASSAGISTADFGPAVRGNATEKTYTGAPMPERGAGGRYTYRDAAALAEITTADGAETFQTQVPTGVTVGDYGVYDRGGFAVDLPSGNASAAHGILAQMQADGWIDASTAAVFVCFTTYNPNVNIFTYNRIMIEYTPAGLVHTSVLYRPFQMPGDDFSAEGGDSQLFIYVIFALNVFVWLAALAFHACKSCGNNADSKFDTWDLVDLVNLLLLALQLAQRIAWQVSFPIITRFPEYAAGDTYFDFEELSWWFDWERSLASINAVSVFLKYFKLLRVSPRLSLLIRVVAAAAKSLLAWLVIAASFFMGFTFMGYIFFGSTLDSFTTLSRAAMTLFNYIVGQFDNVSEGQPLYEGSGLDSLNYAGLGTSVWFADPTFFFFSFNLIFYLFLMRVMVAMLVTAYTEVSREIERSEAQGEELNEAAKDSLQYLPRSWRTTACGRFLSSYILSGSIPFMPEYPSEKHVLERLKAEPRLLEKGYLSYPELEAVVRDALASNPIKCCWRVCGRRLQLHEVDSETVDMICISLLALQRINLHRVPQVMAMFNDIEAYHQRLERGAGSAVGAGADALRPGDIGLDGLEEKGGMARGAGGGESKVGGTGGREYLLNPQLQAEWNLDIMSGDAMHAALYVYREHFERGRKQFEKMIFEQDSALRSLTRQVRVCVCVCVVCSRVCV